MAVTLLSLLLLSTPVLLVHGCGYSSTTCPTSSSENEQLARRQGETLQQKVTHLEDINTGLQEEVVGLRRTLSDQVEVQHVVNDHNKARTEINHLKLHQTELQKMMKRVENENEYLKSTMRKAGIISQADPAKTTRENQSRLPGVIATSNTQLCKALKTWQQDTGMECTTEDSPTCTAYDVVFAGRSVPVYCDEGSAHDWIVIQRRLNGTVNFNRDWHEYKEGFGDPDGEYWLGLKLIHKLTENGKWTLRIDMEDWEGNVRWAQYSSFHVSGEGKNFKLHIAGYRGTAGDAMTYHHGMSFSTSNKSNVDLQASRRNPDCSQDYRSGWWFGPCFKALLTGPYAGNCGYSCPYGEGLYWNTWRTGYSLKTVTMKIRPVVTK
ncbi:hypothetical protein Bbelb_000720 [Branchiostoma belcheri]|nr:hypothetical protein Bbelb_000720 [Branchiostoma belcheri]